MLRRSIIELVGSEAREADWEHVTQADKTAMLAGWVAREDVGGTLRPLFSSDAEVRVWVKEVALKKALRISRPSAESVVVAALGPSAELLGTTLGDKPSHCLARADGECVYLCWDRSANAKHLFWAALMAMQGHPAPARAVVAFIETLPSPTPTERRAVLERVASRCGVALRWIET